MAVADAQQLLPSRLTFGCEQLGGSDWGTIDPDAATAAVRRAWEHGVTAYDTADVYGLGESERRLSLALGPVRRSAYIISKFGIRWYRPSRPSRAETWRDASPAHLVRALEASLCRLRVEQISLYLLHWPDPVTPLDATLSALDRQRALGKIAAFGVSNVNGAELHSALRQGASACQLPLSLIDRRSEPDIRWAREAGATVFAYGVLGQGLLAGSYDHNARFSDDDRRHRLPHFAQAAWPANQRLLRVLGDCARSSDLPMATVAVSWALQQEGVSSVIVGFKRPDQLDAVLQAAGSPLRASVLAALDAAGADYAASA